MRILLADDQPKVRFALRVLLQQDPDFDVLPDAADAWTLLAEVTVSQPDLVLLDWELPGLAEAGGPAGLRRVCPHLKIVALSGRPGARRAALTGGADAFVSKSDPPERLLRTIIEETP